MKIAQPSVQVKLLIIFHLLCMPMINFFSQIKYLRALGKNRAEESLILSPSFV